MAEWTVTHYDDFPSAFEAGERLRAEGHIIRILRAKGAPKGSKARDLWAKLREPAPPKEPLKWTELRTRLVTSQEEEIMKLAKKEGEIRARKVAEKEFGWKPGPEELKKRREEVLKKGKKEKRVKEKRVKAEKAKIEKKLKRISGLVKGAPKPRAPRIRGRGVGMMAMPEMGMPRIAQMPTGKPRIAEMPTGRPRTPEEKKEERRESRMGQTWDPSALRWP